MHGSVLEDRRLSAVAPDRTLEQRFEALGVANDVRVRRAQLKRDLKARRVLVADVVVEPPVWAETMKVQDLLLAVPKVGRVKVGKVLRDVAISPSKTLGGMSVRQRGELVGRLVGR